MKNPKFIPSGKLPIDEFIRETCLKNSLKNSYLIIRDKRPVFYKNVKRAYRKIRKSQNEIAIKIVIN